MRYLETGLWADVRELPGALRDTLAAAEGVAEAATVLQGAERIVATGNGAAYYVAHALWLASLECRGPVPIVAVPCGIAVRDGFRWQPGDVVLAVSSSG
jgi:DNA-binding MurR/RpiR family transcriptional regulator